MESYKAHQQYCVQHDTGACTYYSKGWSVGCGPPHAENKGDAAIPLFNDVIAGLGNKSAR